MTDTLATVLLGAAAGTIFVLAVVDRPADALVVATAALGAVLASAVRRAMGPKL